MTKGYTGNAYAPKQSDHYQSKYRYFQHVAGNFGKNGLYVKSVKSPDEMFEEYIKESYVLIIIDADTYGEDILMTLRHLRAVKSTPILVLLGKSNTFDIMTFLQSGASACMDADASSQLHAAQAMALIQVYTGRDDNKHYETLVFGTSLLIDPIYRIVLLNGETVKLSRKEFDLLYFMAKQNMRVFSPSQLYKNVWGGKNDEQIGDIVKAGIKSLRKKLGPQGRCYIQNKWGVGYRFSGE